MNQVTLYSDWWCPSELSPEWIASHNWNGMLKKYSWAGSLPVISLTLRPNFAVKVYWSYSQACSDSARHFPPALISTNLLWLYWGLQPIAIKLQWQSCGIGWRPLNTLITYMSAHKLREALDTSHFPSSFLTMSLSPQSRAPTKYLLQNWGVCNRIKFVVVVVPPSQNIFTWHFFT
jgi:hypothetical protein